MGRPPHAHAGIFAMRRITKRGERRARAKKICGGKRRSDGGVCHGPRLKGGRCIFHGGASTGPRTAAGIAKVTKNLPWYRDRESSA